MKKKILLFVAVTTLVLKACGDGSESSYDTAINDPETAAVEVEEVQNNKPFDISEDEIQIVIDSLDEGYGSFINTSFDSETGVFHLEPIKGVSLTETLEKIAINPTRPEHEEALMGAADSFIDISRLMNDNISENLYIQMENPTDDDTPMFIIIDGRIEYPVLQ